MAMTKVDKEATIRIDRHASETIRLAVVGTSPLIMHRLASKAKQELLLPSGRRTTADRAQTLKHDPVQEFRDAAQMARVGPTAVCLLAGSFKAALMGAALDLPGATKAQTGRLVYVEGQTVPVFGLPKLFMSVVRSADAKRTPDIRTRPIFERWAATLLVTFQTPLLTSQSIINLLAGAGTTQGVGDWRQEKGKGNYGQFRVANPDDPEYLAITEEGGREAQERLLAEPECYDDETAELLSWFQSELKRRGRLKVA